MIVASMVFVIVGAVTLVLGIFAEDLTWVYVSIGSCVVAGLLLIVGVVRSRPGRKPVLSSGAEQPSWSGAAASWGESGGAATLDRDEEPEAPAGVQVVPPREAETADFEPPEEPVEARPEALEEEEDIVVVPKRTARRQAEEDQTELLGEELAQWAERDEVAVADREEAEAAEREAAEREAAEAAEREAAAWAEEAAALSEEAAPADQPAVKKKAAKKATKKKAAKKATKKKAAKKAAKKKAAKKAAKKKAAKKAVKKKAAKKTAAGRKATPRKAAGKTAKKKAAKKVTKRAAKKITRKR